MRILKKIIRKIYHLIWFLSIFLLFSPKVNAIVNIGGTAFEQSPQVNFYDNSGGNLTSKGAGYSSGPGYWVSNDNIITNGANTDGANINFTINGTFIAGYTYSLSLLIGMESSSVKWSSTRVCIAENITNAAVRFSNPGSFSCTNAFSTVIMSGVASFDYNGYQLGYGMITYVFTADFTAPTVSVVYQSNGSNNSRHVFGGYHLETIAQPNNGLTQQQVQSIVSNSGLATANSVSQVQQSITQIQQDINTSSNNIINNQSQNTQDIIDNQNSNTEQQIESQKVCNIIDKNSIVNDNVYLSPSNTLSSNVNFGVTGYINIFSKEINVLNARTGTASLCFYTKQKDLIGCYRNSSYGTGIYTPPANSYYMRASIEKGENIPRYEICSNGNQALNDSVNNLNDSLTSEESPDINLSDINISDTPISDLVTLPLTLLNSLYSGLSSTCSPWNLPLPYDHNVLLSCFTVSDYVGNTVSGYIDFAICLFMAYNIIRLFIAIFDDITTLSDTYTNWVKRGRY